jgi:hypothetical protein
MYIILRGCFCDIVLNIHALTDDEVNGVKNSFCKELGRVFDKFLEYKHRIIFFKEILMPK